MSCITVTDQQQLDAALADASTTCVHVESERGVWLRVSYGSATVRAYDSATVEAYGSATVRASGSATVHAHHNTTITAGSHTAVHLHSGQATVTGGVLIDVTQLDLTNPAAWCDHHGITVTDGKAVLYKALGDDLTAGQDYGKPTVYTIGDTVTCDDWRDTNDCGGGLHFSPTPHQAAEYCYGATRWLAVEVDVATLRPIEGGTPKAKAPACRVLREVDAFGRLVEGEVTATVTITREG